MFCTLPIHAAEFRSDDVDEVHGFVARFDGNHRRAALEAGPLGYQVRMVRCGEVDAGWGITHTRQRISGVPRDAILHIPTGRRHIYATRGRTIEGRPDTAVLLAPGQEYTLLSEPRDAVVVLRLPGAELLREVANRNAGGIVRTREIPLSQGRLGTLAELYRAIVEGGHAANSQGRSAQLEARLRSWVVGQLLGARRWESKAATTVERVRRVEEWVDAHFFEPVTLGHLCAVAGVGDRHLEAAFRAHRGQAPMQFVAARRLAWVRRRLLEAVPGDSVTQFAHDAGFVHLGRFAGRYRNVYGESPSSTLRRSVARR
jgi:AraC-like DNA-binding protein